MIDIPDIQLVEAATNLGSAIVIASVILGACYVGGCIIRVMGGLK